MKKLIFIVCLLCSFTLLIASKTDTTKSIREKETLNSDGNKRIGISMPTALLIRWKQDGINLKSELENLGYEVDLAFANNEPITQIWQIDNMIKQNCKVLVIAPVDGYSLTGVLEKAKQKNISVISYDRLIMGTDAVSYYITFDKYKAGVAQAEYLINKLNIKRRSKKNPVYMEFFTGDIEDYNVPLFFYGAMDTLNPYIRKKIIVCPSGQTSIESCATYWWSTEVAYNRMKKLIIKNNYGPDKQKLDAVCCSNDSTAIGVSAALEEAGYTPENFPIITGQDCDIKSIQNIIRGTQSMCILLSTKILNQKTVEMVDSIMNDLVPEINNKTRYYNEAGNIQSYLCDPSVVTKDNYKEILIDSGFYSEDDLKRAY